MTIISTTTSNRHHTSDSILTPADVDAIETALINVAFHNIQPDAVDRQALALATYWPGCPRVTALLITRVLDGTLTLPLIERCADLLLRLIDRLPAAPEDNEDHSPTTSAATAPQNRVDVVIETLATYVADHETDTGGNHARTMLLAALVAAGGTTPDEAISLARHDAFDSRVRVAGQLRDVMVARIHRDRLTAIDNDAAAVAL